MVCVPTNSAEKKQADKQMVNVFQWVLCPLCGGYLINPWIWRMYKIERYGVTLRSYLGWCVRCDQGCEVIQYRREVVWNIHRWRPFIIGKNNKSVPGKWIIENELTSPVITGPGGDYDQERLNTNDEIPTAN